MKTRHVTFIILLIILADQALKLWVKTHFSLTTGQDGGYHVLGHRFQIYFVENPGMAYGWKFGGEWGKLALTIFRLLAVIFGTWYLGRIVKQKYHKGFILCAALVYAGALGNLIDSAFYGLIFDKGMTIDPVIGEYVHYNGIAQFTNHGYASFLHGNVVDMLYFPLIRGHFPSWFPIWGGEPFEFFRPIFNLADASISTGVISILVFQRRFFKHPHTPTHSTVETGALVNDESQVS
ncbi:MAG: lipoprotein signal peptidase [Chitinophagaceae bacterium]|nr:lipoprotein signal peptidase [Chitinophagaceae bacterium]MBL0054668.1 lipoprotein signal peptidase [Chitinophagaceae bacterium]